MLVTRLTLSRMRRFTEATLEPRAGVNLIVGDNGAGKTTVLEALHLLAYGRSFRGRVRDGLVRQGEDDLEVFVEWQQPAGSDVITRRAGLRHSGQTWKGRLDGEDIDQLGTLCAALAVVTFEPGSHALVSGSGEWRRRFVDWGLFHVEQEFLSQWRRYARALKQRNALLKANAAPAALDAWDAELAEAGEPITSHRQRYLEHLQTWLLPLAERLAPSLGIGGLEFSPGWRRHELSLADALLLARERDRAVGHTSVGPHRADWSVQFASGLGREALSRGQAKLTALIALLAQAQDHADETGDWPLLALDDLASELDGQHQRRVTGWLGEIPAQVFITATEVPAAMDAFDGPRTVFHVEHGQLQRRD